MKKGLLFLSILFFYVRTGAFAADGFGQYTTGGTYTLTWRYATTDDRPGKLVVNGSTAIPSITFPPTGAFTTWSTVSVDVSLATGINYIRLEGVTSNSTANIDYINIAGENLMTASCP